MKEPANCFGAVLVARGKRGWTPFGYFFGPWSTPPGSDTVAGLRPADALVQLVFDDSPIRGGVWPWIWTDSHFYRAEWPMPEFGMWVGEGWPAYARRRDEDDPGVTVEERTVTPEEALALTQDHLARSSHYSKIGNPNSRLLRLSDAAGIPTPPAGPAEHELSVSFFVPPDRPEAVEELSEELTRLGWTVAPPVTQTLAEDEPSELLLATRRAQSPDLETLTLIDHDMGELAERLHVEYDGHGLAL